MADLASGLSLREQLTWRRLPAVLTPGRLWIGVIAFALIGIVTMQLSLLRINTSIGHYLERSASLQRENAALSIANSEAGSGEAIEQKGRQDGLIPVAPGDLRFLTAGGHAAVAGAVKALRSYTVASGTGISGSQSTAGYVTAATGETALEQSSVEESQTSGEASLGEASTAGVSEASSGQAEQPEAGGEAVAGEYAGSEGAEYGATAPVESEGSQASGGGEGAEAATGEAVALGAGGGVQAGG